MNNTRNPICRYRAILLLCVTCINASSSELVGAELQLRGRINAAPATGNVSFDNSQNAILTTNQTLAIQVHAFGNGTNISLLRDIDLSSGITGGRFISSVVADPLGRGFGVATIIPNANDTQPGKAVFFDTATGNILKSLDVGFNPDNVSFHPDGSKVLVANEAEPGATMDPPGSISIIDVASIQTANDVTTLAQSSVATWDLSPANLASGVSLSNIRIASNLLAEPHMDVEPESIVGDGNLLYVTLQENNAVATFDLTRNAWTAVNSLGTIRQRVDASDRDGPGGTAAALIDDLVDGIPQPDSVVGYRYNGARYYVTTNEGDARADIDFADHGIEGNPFIDPATLAELSARYTTDPAQPADSTDDRFLGRLKISPTDGDTDGDGDIDMPLMFGTRSFSIWNAEDGSRVYDSGSDIEEITLRDAPTLFNADGRPARFDTRSDNKGAEPESLVLGEIAGHTVAFIALERTGGVLMYDITNPRNVQFLDYLNTHLTSGSTSPEGLSFVPSSESVDGRNYLIVGYDGSSSIEVFEILGVPEPSGLTASILAAAPIACACLARRRSARTTR